MTPRRLLFKNFYLVYRLDNWVRRHFTPAGLLLLGSMVTAGVFGIDTRQTLAYQLFTLSAGLLLMAILTGLWFRIRVELQRELPRFGTVDQPLYYRLRVRHLGRRLERGLLISDYLKVTPPSFEEFRNRRDTQDKRRNWFDRQVGYPRWMWLLRQRRGGEIEEREMPPLLPGANTDIRMTLCPRRRGYLEFERICLARPDPLNLFKSLRCFSRSDRVLILPRLYTVPHLKLPGRRKYQQGGINLAMSVGDAVEFVSLREYRPGDALRHIHWKSWARLGKPIVKEFQDEFFVRRALVLDTFPGKHQSEAQFEDAVSLAASFACNMFSQDALLDFLFIGAQAYSFTGGRGLGHLDRMLEILAGVERCYDKSFDTLETLVQQHTQTLSGAICVLLEWDSSRQHIIGLLRERRMPVLVLLVTDDPDYYDVEEIKRHANHAHVFQTGHIEEGLRQLSPNLS